MPRPRLFSAEEIEGMLRFQAQRGLTPEQGAAEMGVSVDTWRRYLSSLGGAIVTNRAFYLPEKQIHDES